jgi:hypothetical protein
MPAIGVTRSPHRLARDAHFLLGLPGKLDDSKSEVVAAVQPIR